MVQYISIVRKDLWVSSSAPATVTNSPCRTWLKPLMVLLCPRASRVRRIVTNQDSEDLDSNLNLTIEINWDGVALVKCLLKHFTYFWTSHSSPQVTDATWLHKKQNTGTMICYTVRCVNEHRNGYRSTSKLYNFRTTSCPIALYADFFLIKLGRKHRK